MGFNWRVGVTVGHVQEVEVSNCYSRFATRCLKLANPVPSIAKKRKQSSKTGAKSKQRLPGQDLSEREREYQSEALQTLCARKDVAWAEVKAEMDAHNDWGCPFSETEEEVEAMRPAHREVYDYIKKTMTSNHADEDQILNYFVSAPKVNQAFKAAVEHLLPGQGKDFAIEVEQHGGAHGEVDEGAKDEIAYLVYKPTFTTAGGHMDGCGRGGVNVPWGNKLTPIQAADAETAKQVDAAFAILVDRLGLEAVGAPGLKLITSSSGG